jgi:hypothetical protein
MASKTCFWLPDTSLRRFVTGFYTPPHPAKNLLKLLCQTMRMKTISKKMAGFSRN